MSQLTAEQALEAIRARLNGEFDHPGLIAFGPLSDTLTDIALIAFAGLVDRKVKQKGRYVTEGKVTR